MFDKIKGAATKVTTMAGDLQGMAVEKLRETVVEINESMPMLVAVGYAVGRIYVELGLSPKVVLSLNKIEDVADAAFDSLIAANTQRRTLCTIVNALRQASVLQGKIQFRNRFFREIEIEMGIPPAVRMIFMETELRFEHTLHQPAALAAPEPQALPAPPVNSPAPAILSAPAPDPVLLSPPSPEFLPFADFPTPVPRRHDPDPSSIATDLTIPVPVLEKVVVPESAPQAPTPIEEKRTTQIDLGGDQQAAKPTEDVVRFRCPACQVRYRVTARRAGEVLACYRCDQELTIPKRSTVLVR